MKETQNKLIASLQAQVKFMLARQGIPDDFFKKENLGKENNDTFSTITQQV